MEEGEEDRQQLQGCKGGGEETSMTSLAVLPGAQPALSAEAARIVCWSSQDSLLEQRGRGSNFRVCPHDRAAVAPSRLHVLQFKFLWVTHGSGAQPWETGAAQEGSRCHPAPPPSLGFLHAQPGFLKLGPPALKREGAWI